MWVLIRIKLLSLKWTDFEHFIKFSYWPSSIFLNSLLFLIKSNPSWNYRRPEALTLHWKRDLKASHQDTGCVWYQILTVQRHLSLICQQGLCDLQVYFQEFITIKVWSAPVSDVLIIHAIIQPTTAQRSLGSSLWIYDVLIILNMWCSNVDIHQNRLGSILKALETQCMQDK